MNEYKYVLVVCIALLEVDQKQTSISGSARRRIMHARTEEKSKRKLRDCGRRVVSELGARQQPRFVLLLRLSLSLAPKKLLSLSFGTRSIRSRKQKSIPQRTKMY